MIAAYNLYLGGFLPEVSPKNSIHNKRELKNKYKSIVSLNNANPLVMVKLSADTQAYALNVKEMSMELSEASQDVLNGRSEDVEDNMNRVLSLYNGLLKRSDEYGEENHKPSRPGGELRYLVEGHTAELFESGIEQRGTRVVKRSNISFKTVEINYGTYKISERIHSKNRRELLFSR